jgi:hypothetical protein
MLVGHDPSEQLDGPGRLWIPLTLSNVHMPSN